MGRGSKSRKQRSELITRDENVHFCNSVFEKSFSTGTSNFLHHATVIL